MSADCFYLIHRHEPGSALQQHFPKSSNAHCDDPVQQLDAGDDANNDEPEPQENVDLRNIQCGSANSIMNCIVTFSLIMFSGKTHRPSKFSTVPEGPNLWNVHLVTFGNTCQENFALNRTYSMQRRFCVLTEDIGSCLWLFSSSVMAKTSVPYSVNWYPKNMSMK